MLDHTVAVTQPTIPADILKIIYIVLMCVSRFRAKDFDIWFTFYASSSLGMARVQKFSYVRMCLII